MNFIFLKLEYFLMAYPDIMLWMLCDWFLRKMVIFAVKVAMENSGQRVTSLQLKKEEMEMTMQGSGGVKNWRACFKIWRFLTDYGFLCLQRWYFSSVFKIWRFPHYLIHLFTFLHQIDPLYINYRCTSAPIARWGLNKVTENIFLFYG